MIPERLKDKIKELEKQYWNAPTATLEDICGHDTHILKGTIMGLKMAAGILEDLDLEQERSEKKECDWCKDFVDDGIVRPRKPCPECGKKYI